MVLPIADEVITTTRGHPFYVKGWVNACDLKINDKLLSSNNQYSLVIKTQ